MNNEVFIDNLEKYCEAYLNTGIGPFPDQFKVKFSEELKTWEHGNDLYVAAAFYLCGDKNKAKTIVKAISRATLENSPDSYLSLCLALQIYPILAPAKPSDVAFRLSPSLIVGGIKDSYEPGSDGRLLCLLTQAIVNKKSRVENYE